jgi:hypothetical protein
MKCSVPFAILLEITANLYVQRVLFTLIRNEKSSQATQAQRRQQGIPQAARQSAGCKAERKEEKKRGSVGCVYTKSVESRRKRSLSIQRKEAVEAVAPALARGWLRQGLGRSTHPLRLHTLALESVNREQG